MEEHGVVCRAGAGDRVSFRPMRPDDAAFLYEVYASTRLDELAVVDWDDTQKAAFLHMQFAAQHQFYQERYTKTDFLIMLRDAVPVGCLYIARWEPASPVADDQRYRSCPKTSLKYARRTLRAVLDVQPLRYLAGGVADAACDPERRGGADDNTAGGPARRGDARL